MNRSIGRYGLVFALSLILALLAQGQQVASDGPPPEIADNPSRIVSLFCDALQ